MKVQAKEGSIATNNYAVTLARVSSRTQEDGYSLDSQQKLLKSYCSSKGLKVAYEFRISETASKHNQRKLFHELLAYVKQHKITDIVAEKTDRLTRNFRDAILVDEWLEEDQRRMLHMVKEGLVIHKDSRSDTKLMWNIHVSFAKKLTDNLREEAMKGWSEKLAQGWMPAPAPTGYKTISQNGRKIHVVDEENAFLVARAFDLYLQLDQNINTVTDELARNGLVTRNGRPLYRTGVHKMLHNPFYMGTIRFDGKEYPGAHEPLISSTIYYAVQEKLKYGTVKPRATHAPLFQGMLRCEHCGKLVTWQLQKGRYYGACQRMNTACKGRRLLREDRLEEQIVRRLEEINVLAKGKRILELLVNKKSAQQNPYIPQHRLQIVKNLRRQISRLDRIEGNLYEDKLANKINEQRYAQKVESLHEERMQSEQRIALLGEIDASMDAEAPKPSSLREMYTQESKSGKRSMINVLFELKLNHGALDLADKRLGYIPAST